MTRSLSLLLLLLATVLTTPVSAQASLAITDVAVEFRFNEDIQFSARIQASAPIQEAVVLFRAEGEENTRVFPMLVDANGSALYRHAVQPGTLQPFSRIEYWFRVRAEGGEPVTSERYSFVYSDNRFFWETTSHAIAQVHWYGAEAAFGQRALDTTLNAIQRFNALIPVSLDSRLNVYVYSSATDLQSALGADTPAWLAGHASPTTGVVMVSITPGPEQFQEMERQIPHELGHVLLYNRVGPAYQRLPAWLREGIASQVELNPNPDYERILTFASQNESLLPMESLCGDFPRDVSGAFLAYAQSASFTGYIHELYGASGLFSLVSAYADGLSCEQGVVRAFGLPLSQLEANWRMNSLRENVLGEALGRLSPYLLLLGLILVIPAWQVVGALRKGKQDDGPTAS